MRWGLYVTLALALNLGLFQFMAGLIAYHRLGLREVVTAYRLDFVRLPPVAEPPPPPRTRLPPPEPKPVAAPRPAGPSAPVRGNVSRLPLPLPALKLEAPLATRPQVAVPPLPSLMVEGEPGPGPAPVRLPPAVPGYVPASELIPVVRIPPLYPPAARRRRIEGYVVVEFTVTETGAVRDPKIVGAQPPGVFDRAVLRAVRRWRFQPKRGKDGKPMAVRARQRLEFRLRR